MHGSVGTVSRTRAVLVGGRELSTSGQNVKKLKE